MKYSERTYRILGAGHENFDSIPPRCLDDHFKYKLCKYQTGKKCHSKWDKVDHCLKDDKMIRNNHFVVKAFANDKKKAMEMGISPTFPVLNNVPLV